MKTYVFIIQTAWLTDVDFAVEAENSEQARIMVDKEWPPKNGHRAFFNYSY
jgi:hypothetical protein